mgnify:FL=1
MDKLKQFYTGKPWRDLSHTLKIQRGGKCERCGFTVVEKSDWVKLIGHHKIELTEANISDPNISLNPDNVEIVCIDCHNKSHRRFGHRKQVYIVWGSPLSGKSTLVRELMQYGDIVLDMDRLWEAITMQPEYIKPNNVRFNVFALRDNLLDQIKTRYGQWYDAYIIGGYPDANERDRLAKTLGAELIYCEATEQECYDRRRESGKPAEWDEYIKKWWEDYRRTGGIPPGGE